LRLGLGVGFFEMFNQNMFGSFKDEVNAQQQQKKWHLKKLKIIIS
jgi:hypothetical protein